MSKAVASQGDMTKEKITFDQIRCANPKPKHSEPRPAQTLIDCAPKGASSNEGKQP